MASCLALRALTLLVLSVSGASAGWLSPPPTPSQALLRSAFVGNTAAVQAALEQGAEVNVVEKARARPLPQFSH